MGPGAQWLNEAPREALRRSSERRWEADSGVERARAITSHSVERAMFSWCFPPNPNLNPNLIAI